MHKLREVEEAKALMIEAMSWSVVKWLREKKRVRRIADKANAVLDELDQSVKAHWSQELRTAYQDLTQKGAPHKASSGGPDIKQLAQQIKDADDKAHQARMDAERTFDEADRLLSTRLAREGCEKAIRSWELHEDAIRRAEP